MMKKQNNRERAITLVPGDPLNPEGVLPARNIVPLPNCNHNNG